MRRGHEYESRQSSKLSRVHEISRMTKSSLLLRAKLPDNPKPKGEAVHLGVNLNSRPFENPEEVESPKNIDW